jgi:D-aminopeptidase
MAKPRVRDLGLAFPGTPGPLNAITDVSGVAVGFTTLTDPALNVRTGVTAIRPRPDADYPRPVWAGFHSLNGNGEMTGVHWICDAGYFLGPILITNTHGIGACHHGATEWMIRHYSAHFRERNAWALPVVAETYDGVLHDINGMHVRPEHAVAALDSATSGPVAEGSVGGGNGMIAYDFKGGTGTSSRIVEVDGQDYVVAALVQANYGVREWFTVFGGCPSATTFRSSRSGRAPKKPAPSLLSSPPTHPCRMHSCASSPSVRRSASAAPVRLGGTIPETSSSPSQSPTICLFRGMQGRSSPAEV